MHNLNNSKISVITVAYNAKNDLELTIKNILDQKYDQLEYIVVDGDSTDGTKELLEKYKDQIDVIVCEPDNGIYDAMNKGIELASGYWLNFMNAGDCFHTDTILSEIDIQQYKDEALVYGNTFYRAKEKVVHPRKILSSLTKGEIFACHQSMFFNKNLLKNELYYRTDLTLAGDSELVARIYAKKFKLAYINETIANYMEGGLSANVTNKKLWEIRRAKLRYIYSLFGVSGLYRWVNSIIFK